MRTGIACRCRLVSFPLAPERGARLLLQAYRNVRTLGDVPGHEFHGNQWTSGYIKDIPLDKNGDVDVESALGKPVSKFHAYADEHEVENPEVIERVALRDLHPTQNEASVKIVRQYVKDPEGRTGNVIDVYVRDGKHYIADGHHRVLAAIARGETHINAVVTRITPKVATLAARDNSPIHKAADRHVTPLTAIVIAAFNKGRKAYKAGGIKSAKGAIRASLLDVLSQALLDVIEDAGNAALGMLPRRRAAGDAPGHEFHGNQWTTGGGGEHWSKDEIKSKLDAISVAQEALDEDSQSDGPEGEKAARDYIALDAIATVLRNQQKANDNEHLRADAKFAYKLDDTKPGGIAAAIQASIKDGQLHLDWAGSLSRGAGQSLIRDAISWGRERGATELHGTAKWGSFKFYKDAFGAKAIGDSDPFTDGQGFKASLKNLEGPRFLATIGMKFDASNPAAAKWAREHAAELADDLSDTSVERIREALAREQETGEDAFDAVLDAVGNEARAELIARTESMNAANEGLAQGWSQAVEEGLLTGDEKKEWIATPGCCDLCDEVDGERVDLDDDFSVGDDPPLHPNCRCTMGLVSA